MSRTKHIYRARKPTLEETRDQRRLLVWGDIAQWMVVDEELASLLSRFDGKRPLKRVLRAHAKRWEKPLDQVTREVEAVLPALVSRDILTTSRRPVAIEPEPVSIANLTINVTNRCNLRCRFCYNAERRTPELPVERLMDALRDARPVLDEGASLILLGGEPLLDLERLLRVLDRAPEAFSTAPMVSTNGTLLTEEAVAALAERRVEVQVSLDGPDPARHDAGRGEGVFERAVSGVRRLVSAKVHTILSMVYTRDALADLSPYLDLALELGVAEARFIPLRLIGGGLESRDACPDQHETFTALLDILARRPETRSLLARDFFTILYTICRYSARRRSCGIGRRVAFIDADGAVYPCPNHVGPEHRAGLLADTSLAEILHDAPVFHETRRRYDIARYTRCRACPFRHWCAGDCRGEVVALTGDPAAPSPHCDELRRVYADMLWLLSEDDPRLGAAPRSPDAKQALDQFL